MKITGKIKETGIIQLKTFTGLKHEVLNCEIVNDSFEFNTDKTGVAHLVKDGKSFFLFIENCDLSLDLDKIENTVFNIGVLNKQFDEYIKEHSIVNQSLSALYYLKTINKDINVDDLILSQKSLIVKGTDLYSSYCWYKHLITSLFVVTQNTDSLKEYQEHFKAIKWSDPFLNSFDLLPELIETQMILIENSGFEIEQMFLEQNKATDAMLQNGYSFEILEYWFDTLEKRSLNKSADYLANKVLSEIENLPKILRYKLETYRGAKKDADAFNFELSDGKMLYDINGKKLLLFGDSKCQLCNDMMPELQKAIFNKEIIPILIADVKLTDLFLYSTDNSIFDAYFVYDTPRMIIVDEQNKIFAKPNSIEHLKAYLN